MQFDETRVPDQAGRIAVVTGANSGIGWECARILAAHGAEVVLACRSVQRAVEAAERLRAVVPAARVHTVELDLSDLASVSRAADDVRERFGPIHLLVNNAGVMAPPFQRTRDGFELQFGTNHLGHFAWTCRLAARVIESGVGSRIVNVASQAHRMGRMRWPDPNTEEGYERWAVYGQSKLANLLFTTGLQQRLTARGASTLAVAAHPGWSATELQSNMARMSASWFWSTVMPVGNALFGQSPSMGALPTVFAATAPEVGPDAYVGPDGMGEWRGYPKLVGRSDAARNSVDVDRLWALSEELTGLSWPQAAQG